MKDNSRKKQYQKLNSTPWIRQRRIRSRTTSLRDRSLAGFTIMELIISSVVLLLAAAMAYSVFTNIYFSMKTTNLTLTVSGNAKQLMDIMIRELREADKIIDITTKDHGGSGGFDTRLRFLTESGVVCYNLNNQILCRSTSPGQAGDSLITTPHNKNVTEISFAGFDAEGKPISHPASSIRLVRISLTVEDDNEKNPFSCISSARLRAHHPSATE